MSCIVVLGMHGSGTSLVASILDALGIDMRYNPNAQVKWYKNFEDTDFIRVDEWLLELAGGNWRKPPSPERLRSLQGNPLVESRIVALIATRQAHAGRFAWGFKDPRACLTVSLLHPYLPNPFYIRVTRSHAAVARSLVSRGGPGTVARWTALSKTYNSRVDGFLKTVLAPVHRVSFEELVTPDCSEAIIADLIKFVGTGKRHLNRALSRIEYSKHL